MKKGFTLIELLAVILILGIIALIAIPQVTNVIDNASKGAAETTGEHYIGAVNTKIGLNKLDSDSSNDIKDGTVDVQSITVDMSGETPTSGNVFVYNGTVVSAQLEINGRNVFCNSNGKCTVVDKYVYYYDVLPKTATINDFQPIDNISLSNTTDTRPSSNVYIKILVSSGKPFEYQVCSYYSNKELCLNHGEYEISRARILEKFEYNESTWTHSVQSGLDVWTNPSGTYQCFFTQISTACQNSTYYQMNIVHDGASSLNNSTLCSIYDDSLGCKSQV